MKIRCNYQYFRVRVLSKNISSGLDLRPVNTSADGTFSVDPEDEFRTFDFSKMRRLLSSKINARNDSADVAEFLQY